jgi:predicted dehydrogenase
MIKFGLAGFGPNARVHLLEIGLVPGLHRRLRLAAGFDPDPAATAALKRKNIAVAGSFDELLASDGIQAVLLSSPPKFHAGQAVAALEAGLHVYSEVPMAIDRQDIERIIDAENGNPKAKYQLGENYCFMAEVLYAGRLASSGRIGPVVCCDSEYLHDVTYRWREAKKGGPEEAPVHSWYSDFDPLAYGHAIGPAQAAMGGIEHPEPFIEVQSYANSIGDQPDTPICAPAEAYHVALFRTRSSAIARCSAAFVFAREPARRWLTLTGATGSFECLHPGGASRLFVAHDHVVTAMHHRAGRASRLGQLALGRASSIQLPGLAGGDARIMLDWLGAIEHDHKASLHATVGGNMCLAGIAASEAARSGAPVAISVFE